VEIRGGKIKKGVVKTKGHTEQSIETQKIRKGRKLSCFAPVISLTMRRRREVFVLLKKGPTVMVEKGATRGHRRFGGIKTGRSPWQ